MSLHRAIELHTLSATYVMRYIKHLQLADTAGFTKHYQTQLILLKTRNNNPIFFI